MMERAETWSARELSEVNRGYAQSIPNDKARMSNDELMTKRE
jgi:hypothetical protein